MGLESATYISDLVSTNPVGSDAKSVGDDHIRLIKAAVKATFPNVTGAVTPTHTELNYVDGVTSAIQTQLDAKAPLASPTFTGNPVAPTQPAGDNSTKLATTAYADQLSFSAALPTQTSHANKWLQTNGTSAAWAHGPTWQTKTTTYTAAAGEAIMADTSGGAWTLTLPASPSANDVVHVADYAGTFATYNLTVARNSLKIMGLSEDMTVSDNNAAFTLTYIDATEGWRLT